MKLTKHFTLQEMTASQEAARQGIDNTPPDNVYINLVRLCAVMESVRTLLGTPITVSSGYRSPELNKAIGGAKASHHMIGLACDFIAPSYGTPLDVCNKIRESDIQYDQLILEFATPKGGGWIHIGIDDDPRRQDLTAIKEDGRTKYLLGHVS